MTEDTVPCADPDIDNDIWFADRTTPDGQADTELAIALCNSCPIVTSCLAQAMREEGPATTRYRHGVRGALTPEQRRALYDQDRPPAQPRRIGPAPEPQPTTLELETAA